MARAPARDMTRYEVIQHAKHRHNIVPKGTTVKAGRVVRLRISPKDCMRIVDALAKMGVDVRAFGGALSFSHATKKVLESCLVALERDGIIPTRDGFEFSQMMIPFPLGEASVKVRATQIAFTKFESHPSYKAEPVVPETPERRSRRIRYEELLFKRRADELNWSEEDQAEFSPLVEEFFECYTNVP